MTLEGIAASAVAHARWGSLNAAPRSAATLRNIRLNTFILTQTAAAEKLIGPGQHAGITLLFSSEATIQPSVSTKS